MFAFLLLTGNAINYTQYPKDKVVNVFKQDLKEGDTLTVKGTNSNKNYLLFVLYDNCDIFLTLENSTAKYEYKYSTDTLLPFISYPDLVPTVKFVALNETTVKFALYQVGKCTGIMYVGNWDFGVSVLSSSSNYSTRLESYSHRCIFGAFSGISNLLFEQNFWQSSGIPSLGGMYVPGRLNYYGNLDSDMEDNEVEKSHINKLDDAFLFIHGSYRHGGLLSVSAKAKDLPVTREFIDYVY